jgi:peptidoglycan LD-endopeptidase CwlK
MNFTDRPHIIRRVQAALGLTPDGIDGPLTWKAIEARLVKLPWADTTPPPTAPAPFDDRTEKNLATLDPKAQPIFRTFISLARAEAAKQGCDYIAISGNRTYAEQDALYAQGRTAPGPIVTKAKGGQSNHNFGIALDFGVFQNGRYLDGGDNDDKRLAAAIHKAVAPHARANGIEWGGDWASFKDLPHFEIRTGLSSYHKRQRLATLGSVL